MDQIIKQLEDSKDYKQALRLTCKNNQISSDIIKGLTMAKMRAFYLRTKTHYQLQSERAKNGWFENELRLFHWILVIKSYLLDLPFKEFKTQQWEQINQFFTPKHPKMLQFQCKKLLVTNVVQYPRHWLAQECELLIHILKDQTLINRWNEVSRLIYDLSDKKYFRSSKQCREQWFNHLDSSKKHGDWQQSQDIKLLQEVLKNGHAWALICRLHFSHRTQHMIKNRFKSLISKKSKKHQTNERKIIRKILHQIKPKIVKIITEIPQSHQNSKKDEKFLQQFVDYQIINSQKRQDEQKEQISTQNSLSNSLQAFGIFPSINPFGNHFHNIYNPNKNFCVFGQPSEQFIYPPITSNFYAFPMNFYPNPNQSLIQ